MRTYKLYFFRHGMTEGNLEGRYIGVTDVDLCQDGIDELEKLKQKFEYPPVGKVYTSPLKRCTCTAALLYPEMQAIVADDLREYDFGIYENKSLEELKTDETFLQWLRSGMTLAPENGEGMDAFGQRIKRGIDGIIKDMMKNKVSSAAVITHGGVIMTLLSMCGLPRRKPMEWVVSNGKGYAVLVNASLWGNTQSFEICDKLPYGDQNVEDARVFDMIDVEAIKKMDNCEQ